MAASNFNMEDPSKQEQIRRGHHEYIPTAGKHGAYAPRIYKHQEYPKMMGKAPKPQEKDFLTANGVSIPRDLALANYQVAMQDWDRYMESTTVQNAAEEKQWLRENGTA